jgi:hypothetical protein
MAATVVINDPTFGWMAYGAAMKETGTALSINPRDGLRRRLDIVIQDRTLPFADSLARFKLELERDGLDAKSDIVMDKALNTIRFTLENRTGGAHTTGVRLALPVNSHYTLTVDGKATPLVATGNPDYPWRAEMSVGPAGARVEIKSSKP